jgi:hypothetical protein
VTSETRTFPSDRKVEAIFRLLRSVHWHPGPNDDGDRVLSWLREYSQWFELQSGITSGYNRHLQFDRQLASFGFVPQVMADVFPYVASIGYSTAIVIGDRELDAVLEWTELRAVRALAIELTGTLPEQEVLELLQRAQDASITLSLTSPPAFLTKSLLDMFSDRGTTVTIVMKRARGDAWLPNVAECENCFRRIVPTLRDSLVFACSGALGAPELALGSINDEAAATMSDSFDQIQHWAYVGPLDGNQMVGDICAEHRRRALQG